MDVYIFFEIFENFWLTFDIYYFPNFIKKYWRWKSIYFINFFINPDLLETFSDFEYHYWGRERCWIITVGKKILFFLDKSFLKKYSIVLWILGLFSLTMTQNREAVPEVHVSRHIGGQIELGPNWTPLSDSVQYCCAAWRISGVPTMPRNVNLSVCCTPDHCSFSS